MLKRFVFSLFKQYYKRSKFIYLCIISVHLSVSLSITLYLSASYTSFCLNHIYLSYTSINLSVLIQLNVSYENIEKTGSSSTITIAVAITLTIIVVATVCAVFFWFRWKKRGNTRNQGKYL